MTSQTNLKSWMHNSNDADWLLLDDVGLIIEASYTGNIQVNDKAHMDLIAAAPELLAVAKTAKCPDCTTNDFDMITGKVPAFKCPWCSMREQAIEKAEFGL